MIRPVLEVELTQRQFYGEKIPYGPLGGDHFLTVRSNSAAGFFSGGVFKGFIVFAYNAQHSQYWIYGNL
ncbi:MAG: hypothetical protein KDK05_11915 [Candidatus Competibacteraceae bacterium]|nr:hypothetical protein [Candidatus Competibacteraceae bacterium]